MPGITHKSTKYTVRLNHDTELKPIIDFLERLKKNPAGVREKYVNYSVGEFVHIAVREKLAHILRSRRKRTKAPLPPPATPTE